MPKDKKAKPLKCIVLSKAGPKGEAHTYLLDDYQVIKAKRPTLLLHTGHIDRKLQEGKIEILARNLPDEATDADFVKTWRKMDKDNERAIKAYCAVFGQKPDGGKTKTEKDA